MRPETRKRALWWAKTALMVIAFAGMLVALDRLIRSYSLEQVIDALGALPWWVVALAALVLVAQHGLLIVREWLAVRYAHRAELGLARTALASVVSRSLSTLGVASITGVGLRLHIYGGWGLDGGDVARITTYNEVTYAVGLTAQVAVVLGVLPVPPALAGWVGVPLVRLIGAAGAALMIAYLVWCLRRGRDLKIRSLVITVPRGEELAGQVLLPLADRFLGAAIVWLCLSDDAGLGYLDVVTICFLAAVAGSLTQIPAGLGILEGMMVLFVPDAAEAPGLIAGLLVARILTNLAPVVVGSILLVILEVSRRRDSARPEGRAETTATALAALTFLAGLFVMVTGVSPLAHRFGEVGRLVIVAVGTGLLFVARGLERRSRRAWQIVLGLVIARAVAIAVVVPPWPILVVLVLLAVLLIASHRVFAEDRYVVDAAPGWWIAFAMAIAGTVWLAIEYQGKQVTDVVVLRGAAMLAVVSITGALVIAHLIARRRKKR